MNDTEIIISLTARLSSEWNERTVPLIYISLNVDEPDRPTCFQKHEKVWTFSPRPKTLKEDVTEIGLVVIPCNDTKKLAWEWRGFIPYHVHKGADSHSMGYAATLEEAKKAADDWVRNTLCGGIKNELLD